MILYTIGCPQCNVLEQKLDKAGISYEKCTDKEVMRAKHMVSAPMLELDDGTTLDFSKAVKWVNEH